MKERQLGFISRDHDVTVKPRPRLALALRSYKRVQFV